MKKNENMKKAVFNWSGGKDSALCLYHCLQNKEIDIKYLLTTVSREYNRISMHGVRRELLKLQTESIEIKLHEVFLPEMASMSSYDKIMKTALEKLTNEEIEYSIFGDIFLEDLKKYRENKLAEVSMKGLFPLWNRSTKELIKEFIDLGFKTIVVCANEKYLDKSFAGRVIDNEFVNDLPDNVDPCGENGEFHTFVYDGPIFKKPISFKLGDVVHREYKPNSNNKDDKCFSDDNDSSYDTGFWYRDLLIKNSH